MRFVPVHQKHDDGCQSMARAAQEGVIALWKGWLPSVIGVVPYVGLNFAVYETLKDVVLKLYGDQLFAAHEFVMSVCHWRAVEAALRRPDGL